MTKHHLSSPTTTSKNNAAGWWYLMELRKIFVRKLLATCTSVSDGIVPDDTTSTILALMGGEWWKEKKEKEEERTRQNYTLSNKTFCLSATAKGNKRVWRFMQVKSSECTCLDLCGYLIFFPAHFCQLLTADSDMIVLTVSQPFKVFICSVVKLKCPHLGPNRGADLPSDWCLDH